MDTMDAQGRGREGSQVNESLVYPIPLQCESSVDPRKKPWWRSLVPFVTNLSLSRPRNPIRMHSVLSTFFQTPVSGEEKKRRMQERISGSCVCLFFFSF